MLAVSEKKYDKHMHFRSLSLLSLVANFQIRDTLDSQTSHEQLIEHIFISMIGQLDCRRDNPAPPCVWQLF